MGNTLPMNLWYGAEMKEIDIRDICRGTDLTIQDAFIFWHPKKPGQFKAKVADVFYIPNTIYGPNGEFTPMIQYALEGAKGKGWLYTLI